MARSYTTPMDMTTFYQTLMAHRWRVISSNASGEVQPPDVLQFTPDMKIERTDTMKSGDWAVSCFVSPDGLQGATLTDNRPFLIQLDTADPLTGTCTFLASAQQRAVRAVALGTVAGAVIGAVAGALTGSWATGALTGAVASFAGALATAAQMNASGHRTGSSATLAVDDGKSGGREIMPGDGRTATA